MSVSESNMRILNTIVDQTLYQPSEKELYAMGPKLGDRIVDIPDDQNPEIEARSTVTTTVAVAAILGILVAAAGITAAILLHTFVPGGITIGVEALIVLIAGKIIYDNHKSTYLGIREEREQAVKDLAGACSLSEISERFSTDEVIGYRLLDGLLKPDDSDLFRTKVYCQYARLAEQRGKLEATLQQMSVVHSNEDECCGDCIRGAMLQKGINIIDGLIRTQLNQKRETVKAEAPAVQPKPVVEQVKVVVVQPALPAPSAPDLPLPCAPGGL